MTAAAATFTADPMSVTDARSLVERTIEGCPASVIADALLLTSELVSNVVLHAATPFEVEVQVRDDLVRVVVRDGSTDPPVVHEPAADETGGRGLLLVHSLSTRWGYEATKQGKAVWFELEV
jgi:anti-sigma regulatory factor (Ser/Thr protein kinase)